LFGQGFVLISFVHGDIVWTEFRAVTPSRHAITVTTPGQNPTAHVLSQCCPDAGPATEISYREWKGKGGLLADKKHIDSAKVEVIEEGKRGKPVVCGMLSSIKLD
jgi:hypothetical protein